MDILTKDNVIRRKLKSIIKTTDFFDEFYSNESKLYIALTGFIYTQTCKLNLILSKKEIVKCHYYSDKYGSLTITNLKRVNAISLYEDMTYYQHEDDIQLKYKVFPLCEELSNIFNAINSANCDDVILFKNSIPLRSQSKYDRRKGTFDGGNYYTESVKLYGETSYETFICGVEVM